MAIYISGKFNQWISLVSPEGRTTTSELRECLWICLGVPCETGLCHYFKK